MPAVESCLIPAVFDQLTLVTDAGTGTAITAEHVADLREYVDWVPVPRARRGVGHLAGSLLALTAAVVLAGARSFAVIGEWIADVSQRVLAELGARFDPGQDRYLAPEESTVRRLTQRIDGDVLDAAVSAWLACRTSSHTGQLHVQGQPAAVAVDGKALRGTPAPPKTATTAAPNAAPSNSPHSATTAATR